MTPEARLTVKIANTIRKQRPGAFVKKIHGGMYGSSGFPDLLVFTSVSFRGAEFPLPLALEVKTPTGKDASALQKESMANLIRVGVLAGVVRSEMDAIAVVANAELVLRNRLLAVAAAGKETP